MNKKLKRSINFSLTIAVITFVLAAIFSVISSSLLSKVDWEIGLLIVFIIIIIGILFDMLGIASTAADEAPFHAMASEKVKGAKEAVIIIKNADRFSSFSNDVIGDISGIVSGTATVVVVLNIANLLNQAEGSLTEITLNVFLTSLVAALTVGGKAIGKFFAINHSISIIMFAGKIISIIEGNLKIKIFPRTKR